MAIVRELVTILGYDVEDKKIEAAERAVEKYKRAALGAADATRDFNEAANEMSGGISKFAFRVAGLASAALGVRAIINELTEFERLMGILIVLEGGEAAADRAFQFIDQFARQTPFNIDQVTSAFIRLRAIGIQPTERMLTGLGNVAAAMGSDLDEITDATLKLRAGLSRQLKRILKVPISLTNSGRTLTMEFRKQKIVIENTTDAVLDLLIRLGENEFAGGLAMQMERLPGLLSNAKDAVKRFVRSIGAGGLQDVMKKLLTLFIDAQYFMMRVGRAIGKLVTPPLQLLGLVIDVVSENARGLKAALAFLLVLGSAIGLAAIIEGLTALGMAATGAAAGFTALQGSMLAIVALLLVIQDFIFFLTGRGESSIGNWVEEFKDAEGAAGDLARYLDQMRGGFSGMKEWIDTIDQSLQGLRDTLSSIWDILSDIMTFQWPDVPDAIERLGDAVQRALGRGPRWVGTEESDSGTTGSRRRPPRNAPTGGGADGGGYEFDFESSPASTEEPQWMPQNRNDRPLPRNILRDIFFTNPNNWPQDWQHEFYPGRFGPSREMSSIDVGGINVQVGSNVGTVAEVEVAVTSAVEDAMEQVTREIERLTLA